MLRKILLCATLIGTAATASAQSDRLGSWSVINTRIGIDKKWEFFNELQLRSQSFYDDFFYYEVKGGISYKLNKNFNVLIGTGKYITYDITEDGSFNKPIDNNETRLWQQITMNNYLERIKFEHRYRIEQQWHTSSGYRNRFRYRLNAMIPLNKPSVEPGSVYLSTFNEIFLTNKADYFLRNRFFLGFGYQLNKTFGLTPGYVYQYDYNHESDRGHGKHFFQLTFMISVDNIEDAIRGLPSTLD